MESMHRSLDHVIGGRIPASQPAFARLRRASARSALRADVSRSESRTREGCLAEAAWRAKADLPRFHRHVSRKFFSTALRAFGELRLGQRFAPTYHEASHGHGEGCLAEARVAGGGGPPTVSPTRFAGSSSRQPSRADLPMALSFIRRRAAELSTQRTRDDIARENWHTSSVE